MYNFVNPKEIKNFLYLNKDLIPFIEEAPNYIYHIFGSDVLLYLELHTDPEELWNELFIVIKLSYDTEKALQLEENLFKEWFVYIRDKVKNKLNIAEEPL